MDRKLIKVYIFLLVAFIAVFPLVRYKDILITDIADSFTQLINHKIQDITMGMTHCPPSDNQRTKKPLSPNKAKIIFVLDDNWESQYTFAFQVLKRRNFPATIAVIPSKVNQPDYMSLSQLQDVYRNGWDLVNHTFDHKNLSTLDREEQSDQIMRGTAWLNSKCFTQASNIVVYPYGAFNSSTIQVLAEKKYRGARSLIEGFEKNQPYTTYQAKVQNLTTPVTTEQVKDWIDEAIQNKKTLIFVNHRFADQTVDPTSMIYDKTRFVEVVNYLAEVQDKVQVITYSEWLDNEQQIRPSHPN
ncbi:Polysaccharide deacetylase [Seinonella peptonophila]|uniref:Polysaccharide deacetylase n=1 Tax=Seinonella peptonophila TaxID=112248 RepID=A0A1M4U0E6_9BACL|nr:polysaccharide deacetylase family protein [Seinonella peptonophila]SHE50056.1 Polysaccharide deacetylase [Seinonella peptonophila]